MRVVCVCTGNTCRSPMAAALLRERLCREAIAGEVRSAGLAAGGEPATPMAQAVMAECGLDIAAHHSAPVTRELLDWADAALVMTAGHREALRCMGFPADRIVVLGEESGGIPDPYGGDREMYRETRERLAAAIRTLDLAICGTEKGMDDGRAQ